MTAGGADAGGTWLPWHGYVRILKFVLGTDSLTIISSKYVNCVEIVDGWRATVFKLHLRGGELFRLDLGNAVELG